MPGPVSHSNSRTASACRLQTAAVVLGFSLAFQLAAAGPWTLEDAIAQSLNRHPDARMAYHQVQAARAGLEQARSAWWPRFDVQSGYTYTDNPVAVFGSILNQQSYSSSLDFNNVPDTDNWNLRGQVTLPLYTGGRTTAQRNAARAEAEASEWDQATLHLNLEFEVTRTWLAVHQMNQFLRTAEATVQSYQAHLSIAEERLTAGTILKPEVLDLRVKLETAREELVKARHAHELTRLALGVLLGIENGKPEVAANTVTLASPETDSTANRPELIASELRQEAARAAVREARSGFLPEVNAFGAVDYDYGFRNDGGNTSYTTGILLRWNLWDGRLTRGRVHEAEARLESSRAMETKIRNDIRFEINRAELALKEAAERLQVAESARTLARESVELNRARFEEGLSLASQLIDSESALTAAEVRWINAGTDRQIAIAALRKAYGLSIASGLNPATP